MATMARPQVRVSLHVANSLCSALVRAVDHPIPSAGHGDGGSRRGGGLVGVPLQGAEDSRGGQHGDHGEPHQPDHRRGHRQVLVVDRGRRHARSRRPERRGRAPCHGAQLAVHGARRRRRAAPSLLAGTRTRGRSRNSPVRPCPGGELVDLHPALGRERRAPRRAPGPRRGGRRGGSCRTRPGAEAAGRQSSRPRWPRRPMGEPPPGPRPRGAAGPGRERAPWVPDDTKSGARFERVVIGGERFVLKYQDPEDDWLLRANGDPGRSYVAAVGERTPRPVCPAVIDHAVVAPPSTARWGGCCCRDVGRRPARTRRPVHTRSSTAFHRHTWRRSTPPSGDGATTSV